jgi:hypothetical protein
MYKTSKNEFEWIRRKKDEWEEGGRQSTFPTPCSRRPGWNVGENTTNQKSKLRAESFAGARRRPLVKPSLRTKRLARFEKEP